MDIESAKLFRSNILDAFEALSRALTAAQKTSAVEEFGEVRMAIGDVIARLDNLLNERVYADHPELNEK